MVRRPKISLVPLSIAIMVIGGLVLAVIPRGAMADDVVLDVDQLDIIELEVQKGILIRLPRPASQIFLAAPAVADIQVKSQRLIYVFAKRPGETTLYAIARDDTVIAEHRIMVTHNLTRLEEAIATVVPMSAVQLESVQGNVLMTGAVQNATDAESIRQLAAQFLGDPSRIINQIAVLGPNQINLRVRIVEMSRNVAKRVGFDFELVQAIGSDIVLDVLTGFTAGGVVGGFAPDQIGLGFSDTHTTLDVLVDMLEGEGLLTTLAAPNLTALSGETASFLVGGEFPIPVGQTQNGISITFKEFGVRLAFTPTLVGNGRISLHVIPEVSQLSTTGSVNTGLVDVPALTVRRADTTVELGSGQSFAIAGLLQNNVQHDIRKFPGLGDIPILGGLFRSDTFIRNETELVIIVTPYLVEPVSTQLVEPIEGYEPPNDLERLMFGKHFRPSLPHEGGGPLLSDGMALIGPAGYILN